VKNGDLVEVARLLKQGVDPNCMSSDWYKTRPIILAASGGHTEILRLLLDQPALDPNLSDGLFGNTALIDASHAGNTDVVRMLVEDHRVDLNYKTKGSGITALMQAARCGHTSVVEMLVMKEEGGVNMQSGGGCTPLMLGCMAPNKAVLNDPQMFRVMLAAKGLDLTIKDGQGKTALDWARDKELFMVEKLMIESEGGGKEVDKVIQLELQVRMLQEKLDKSENLNKALKDNVEELNMRIKDQEVKISFLKEGKGRH